MSNTTSYYFKVQTFIIIVSNFNLALIEIFSFPSVQ